MLPTHGLLHARLSAPQEVLRGCERPGRDTAEGKRGHGAARGAIASDATRTGAELRDPTNLSDEVIRENPSAARGFAGAPKNRQRILSVHRGGCSWNAGPQQWYEGSEALQTAAQWAPPPGQSSPPPSASLRFGVGKHRGGEWVRQFGPPCVPPGRRISFLIPPAPSCAPICTLNSLRT